MDKLIDKIIEIASNMSEGIFVFAPGYNIAKKGDKIGIRIGGEPLEELYILDLNISDKKILRNLISVGDDFEEASEEKTKMFLENFIFEYNDNVKTEHDLINVIEYFESQKIYQEIKTHIQVISEAMEILKKYFKEAKNMSDDEIIEYSMKVVMNSDIEVRVRLFEAGKLNLDEKDAMHYEKMCKTKEDAQILDCTFSTLILLSQINGEIEEGHENFKAVVMAALHMLYNIDV